MGGVAPKSAPTRARARFYEKDKSATTVQKSRFSIVRNEATWKIHVNEPGRPCPEVYDLAHWANLGEIGTLLFDGYAAYAKRQSEASTRNATLRNLENGFVLFCQAEALKAKSLPRIELLSTPALVRYIGWLDAQQTKEGKELSIETKRHYLSAIRLVLKTLAPELKRMGIESTCPQGPWTQERGSKTKPLSPDDHRRLFLLAAEAVIETMEAVEPAFDRILEYLEQPPASTEDKYGRLVVRLLKENAYVLPERKCLEPRIREQIDKHGYMRLQRVVAPQLNDLIPFVLYLALMTGYNEQPLLSLAIDEIDRTTIFGRDQIVTRPGKNRGRELQARAFFSTDEALSPPKVIAFLEKWTSLIRRSAPGHCAKTLFIAANKWKFGKKEVVLAFGDDVAKTRQAATALTNFLKGHFDHFIGTRITRASFAELVSVLTDGDHIAVKVLLGHKTDITTLNAYWSDKSRTRGEKSLAIAQAQVNRTVATNGRVDFRRQNIASDRSAATPGWSCIDPYDSPIRGEIKGRLCQAYGHCPGCPLGAPKGSDPVSFSRALQLLHRMEEARDSIGIAHFSEQFGDAYLALREVHLPRLTTPETVNASKQLTLNELPRLI